MASVSKIFRSLEAIPLERSNNIGTGNFGLCLTISTHEVVLNIRSPVWSVLVGGRALYPHPSRGEPDKSPSRVTRTLLNRRSPFLKVQPQAQITYFSHPIEYLFLYGPDNTSFGQIQTQRGFRAVSLSLPETMAILDRMRWESTI